MNDLLKALYDTFYKPPKMTETLSEIKSIHQQLVEQLDKPARRLVLKLVDNEEKVADDLSLDSFIAGFQLNTPGWNRQFDRARPTPLPLKSYTLSASPTPSV